MIKRVIMFVVVLLMVGFLNGCGSVETQGTPDTEKVKQESVSEATLQEDNEGMQESESAPTKDDTKEEQQMSSEQQLESNSEVAQVDDHESAQDAVNNMLIGWNLGNSFDATGEWITQYTAGTVQDFETAWGNPVTPDTLMRKLKEQGFNAVRIPITWRYHFDENGKIDEVWMARVQEVVDWAMEADLYCIINIHHDTGSDGWLRATAENYEENADLYAELWRQIAERFQEYPDTLLFEGFNEMLDDKNEWNNPGAEAIKAINDYNQLFVNTVRATGGNNAARNLICCTYAAAVSPTALKGFQVPEDSANNHLIAEVHLYTPYEFITDEGVTWTTPISEYTAYVESSIDYAFDNIKNIMMKNNVPVIIGEFATDDKDNTEDRIKWYTHVIEKANELDITCILWDNGNDFCMGHIDRVENQDAFPEIIAKCIETAK